MTPELDAQGSDRPLRLKKRPLFLRAASGRKSHGALFTVQAFARPLGEADRARAGFTVTKKVGGAVERNRIKRRLREVVRIAPNLGMRATHDYVIVARRAALTAPFPALQAGVIAALTKVHEARRVKAGLSDTK